MVRSWIVLAALLVAACGSTSTESLVGPGAPKCTVSLSGPEGPLSPSGGPGTVTVSTQPECEWTAAAEAAWITELTPTQGQGSRQVQFQAAPNPSGVARESAIAINGQRALVRQNPAACELVVAANASQFPPAGGAGTITISAPAGCPWTAAGNVNWIAVSPASGAGSGSIAFTVAPNTGAERTGTITAGGVAIGIGQAGVTGTPPPPPSCTISLQQSSTSMPAAGGQGTIGITTTAGCPWTANSLVPWITLTTTSGSGGGSIGFTVAANTGTAARSGSVNVGGVTFTVNQAGTAQQCSYSISPTSQSIGAAGGTGTAIAVSTSSGCTWTASSTATWLTITSGASGSGGGNVNFTVAANTGNARTGTLNVAGQTFTVNQAATVATCTYSINPSSITVGDDAVSGLTIAVTTATGCSWSASSQAGWVQITSGSSGNGSGTVTYGVSNYNGSSRTGTMTIAGQTFTITQVRCSATLNPQTQPVSALGGSFTVSVTTQIGCGWQAVESLNWVSITSGSSGTGSGTVGYTVSPNLGGSRSGSIAIAGRTLTVNQAGVTGGGGDDD